MFHRVKSEIGLESNQEQQSTQAPEKSNITDLGTFKKAEESRQESPAAENEKSSTENEKEIQTMNEHAQGNASEAPQQTAPEAPANPYQRSTQTTTAPSSSAYSASGYPGASSYASTPAAAAADKGAQGDRRLTIGAGITMSGEIEACDYLVVEGTLEAALKGARVVEIAESGVFYGTVEIGEATVAGRFEGDLTVNGRLTIRASGVVTGSISYGELEVEAGAVIDGRLTPVTVAKSASAPAEPARRAEAAPLRPKAAAPKADASMAPANSDGQLFSEKAAAE